MMANEERLTRGLGLFSIGLGLAQVAATRVVAESIGVPDGDSTRTVLRLVGAREITAGLGTLTQRWPVAWLWARVAGDAMDLALLGRALLTRNADRNRVLLALASVAGITILDLRTSLQQSRRPATARGRSAKEDAMHVKQVITVNRSPEEVYGFWHDFQNLPQFMPHLESVQVLGNGRSHWKTKAPIGKSVEWDAEITEDKPNQVIAWHSVDGAEIENAGAVHFERAPGGRGTVVRVELDYDAPGGEIGKGIAKLFGDEPNQQVTTALRVFKQVLETGQVTKSEATVQGQGPARPPAEKISAE